MLSKYTPAMSKKELQQATLFLIRLCGSDDRRFSQLDIGLIHASGYAVCNIVTNKLANGSGKIEIDRINVLGHEAILQGPFHRFAYGGGFFVETQMIEQHGS